MPSNKGSIVTVSGEMDPDLAGITLPHEHLLIDGTCWWKEPAKDDAFRQRIAPLPVTMDLLGAIRRAPTQSVKSNLVLNDPNLAEKEILEFKKAGGATVVDATSIGLNRNPSHLRTLSEKTGLKIVAGSGFYVQASHPAYVSTKTAEELSALMVREVQEGIDGTGIRPGVLGEIGLSPTIFPSEEKVLRAACMAQRRTGLALMIHSWISREDTQKIWDIIDQEGCDPTRVVMAHCDSSIDGSLDLETQKEIAKRKMYVEYDLFGSEEFRAAQGLMLQLPHDSERIKALRKLVDSGFLDYILISQDVCRKQHLKAYGGWGYAHILNNVLPVFRAQGFTERELETILVENPKRMLTVG